MDSFSLNLLIMAGLLHDVGKAAQRAGRPKSSAQESARCYADNQGGPRRIHTLYTDYFIQKDLGPCLPDELRAHKSWLASLAATRDEPDGGDLLKKALCTADRLSAGTDALRGQEADSESSQRARLLSPFSYIRLEREGASSDNSSYYPLSALNSDAFPTSLEAAQETDYADLFRGLLDDLGHLPLKSGLKHYTDSLQSLLEKYLWCVPASTSETDPDISLFDHAYATAAIAQALTCYHSEQGGLPGEAVSSQKKFLLLGADLSGIQKHIFGIEKSHSAGVAKILRARSFLLQAAVRSVVNSLLKELGLMPQARIMDAGGELILLLPNTDSVRSRLPEFETRVQRWFLEAYQGEVSLILSYEMELSEQDLQDRFQEAFNRLQGSLQKKKLSRFDVLFQDSFSPVLVSDLSGFQSGACHVCGIHPVHDASSNRFAEGYNREIPICQWCFEQIDIVGTRLPRSKYIVYSRNPKKNSIELFDGIHLSLLKNIRDEAADALEIVNYREYGKFAHHAIAGHLPTLTGRDIERMRESGELSTDGRGNWVWTREEEYVAEDAPKTLSMLAQEAKVPDSAADGGARGKALLAGLKADVDNLGMILGTGLGERLSISRFAFISRMLNHFFASYLVERIQKEYPDIYVVFAGGDDLFFLGPWVDITDIAGLVSDRFAAYTAQNPEITLSAGISVHKPKKPVHGIVQRAEALLEESKKRQQDGVEVKNGVTLFGVTVDWDRYRELLDKARWIEDLVEREKITRGLVGRMLHYADQHKKWMQGDIRSGLYMAHMEYDFKRNVYDRLGPEDAPLWRQIETGLKNVQKEMDQLRMPVTWALYRVRSEA